MHSGNIIFCQLFNFWGILHNLVNHLTAVFLKSSHVTEYLIATSFSNYMVFNWHKVKRVVSIYFTDMCELLTIAECFCIFVLY